MIYKRACLLLHNISYSEKTHHILGANVGQLQALFSENDMQEGTTEMSFWKTS